MQCPVKTLTCWACCEDPHGSGWWPCGWVANRNVSFKLIHVTIELVPLMPFKYVPGPSRFEHVQGELAKLGHPSRAHVSLLSNQLHCGTMQQGHKYMFWHGIAAQLVEPLLRH